VGGVQIQIGAIQTNTINAGTDGTVMSWFDVSFSSPPLVVAILRTSSYPGCVVSVDTITTSSCIFNVQNNSASNVAFDIYWVAIGVRV
jgi:hypothetical protein